MAKSIDEITIELDIYDDESGDVVDRTTADLTRDQVSRIVSLASEMILRLRDNCKLPDNITVLLEDELVKAGLIDEEEEIDHSRIYDID